MLAAQTNEVKNNVKAIEIKQKALEFMIHMKNEQLIKAKEQLGRPQSLKAEALAKFNQELVGLKKENGRQEDQMSEFSILTDESELLAKENRLDLRISTVSFDRIPLV